MSMKYVVKNYICICEVEEEKQEAEKLVKRGYGVNSKKVFIDGDVNNVKVLIEASKLHPVSYQELTEEEIKKNELKQALKTITASVADAFSKNDIAAITKLMEDKKNIEKTLAEIDKKQENKKSEKRA